MKWAYFNLSVLIVGFALILNGAPWLPVVLGLAGAGAIRKWRK